MGDLRTRMTHTYSGSVVETDAPLDNQGKAERFSPTDLVASALGACMLTIMGIAARAHHINIEGTTLDIEKIMVAQPTRRIGEIKVSFHFPTPHTYTHKEKTILEKAALTCPVFESLSAEVIKTVHFNW